MGQKSVLSVLKRENLGTAALKEQDFIKDQKNMESECSSSESVRNDSLCRREQTIGKKRRKERSERIWRVEEIAQNPENRQTSEAAFSNCLLET